MTTPTKSVVRYAALGLFGIPWIIVPMWLLVVNSFKGQGEAAMLSLSLPTDWALIENYSAVLVQGRYFQALLNSAIVTVPTIICVLLLGSMAAWAYARSKSLTLHVAYYLSCLSILLPPAVVPTIYVINGLGLRGGMLGYVLFSVAIRLGLAIFMTTGFVKGLPRDLEEAALIDGATRVQTYLRIILPMLTPILFVGAVILMISVWNDFFFAMFMLNTPDRQTLPLSLYNFASGSFQTLRWNLVFAHVIMTSLPLVIAYFFLQKKVISGLTEGAMKG